MLGKPIKDYDANLRGVVPFYPLLSQTIGFHGIGNRGALYFAAFEDRARGTVKLNSVCAVKMIALIPSFLGKQNDLYESVLVRKRNAVMTVKKGSTREKMNYRFPYAALFELLIDF